MSRILTSMTEPGTKDVAFVKNENVDIQSGCYGTWQDIKGHAVFIPKGAAVYIKSIDCEIDTGEKTLVLYFNDSAGREITVRLPRQDLTEQGIMALMAYGVQVTKQDAKTLIWSLQNQEPDVAQCLYHKHLGFFQYNKKKVFLGGNAIGVESAYRGELKVMEHGSYKKWLSMIEHEVLGTIPLELMLAVGVSGVIADFLKEDVTVENIIVHCINESSTGKTTAALLAVSCGASPSFKGDSLVFSFADTQNALMSSLQSSYASLIDEGSLCRGNPTNFLYNLSMGKEKRRMTKELGISDSSYFKTAVIITSEKSILNLCDENSGLLVRNLEFEGVQWTKDAASADRIKDTIQSNYGFLVPKVAKALLDIEENGDLDTLLENYWGWCKRIVDDAKEKNIYNSLTERGSKQSALIMLGAELVTDILSIPLNLDAILQMLEEHSLLNDPDTVDIGSRAHQYLMQYMNRFYANFISEDVEVTTKECMGRIKASNPHMMDDGRVSSRLLLIGDLQFQAILKDGGFMDKRVVLKRMKALGLLKCESDRYLSDIVVQDGIRISGYMIRIPDVHKTLQRKPEPVMSSSSRKVEKPEDKEADTDEADTIEFDEEVYE